MCVYVSARYAWWAQSFAFLFFCFFASSVVCSPACLRGSSTSALPLLQHQLTNDNQIKDQGNSVAEADPATRCSAAQPRSACFSLFHLAVHQKIICRSVFAKKFNSTDKCSCWLCCWPWFPLLHLSVWNFQHSRTSMCASHANVYVCGCECIICLTVKPFSKDLCHKVELNS